MGARLLSNRSNVVVVLIVRLPLFKIPGFLGLGILKRFLLRTRLEAAGVLKAEVFHSAGFRIGKRWRFGEVLNGFHRA